MVIYLNPNDKSSNCVLSNNNLTVKISGSGGIRATKGINHGKWYWEISTDSINNAAGVGITNINAALNIPGIDNNGYGYYSFSGAKYHAGQSINYGGAWQGAHTIGVALDLDNKTLGFYRDGSYQGIAYNISEGIYYPAIGNGSSSTSPTITINFGDSNFKYSIPEGFQRYSDIIMNKYLIKQDEQYYSVKDNTLTSLGIPTDDIQKQQWFDDYGVEDLKDALLTPDTNGNKLIDSLDNQFEIRMMKEK